MYYTTRKKIMENAVFTADGPYQKALQKRAPELNPLHMETLAYMAGSTLNGMPPEFFDEIAGLAKQMGADRLEELHKGEIV
jgi:hypothetical protein